MSSKKRQESGMWISRPSTNSLPPCAIIARRRRARCARLSPPTPSASRHSPPATATFCSTGRNARSTQRTMDLLEKLAGAADLEGRRAAMFAGKKINITEDRAVLHTALRNLTRQGRHASTARTSRRMCLPCSTPWAPLPMPSAPARRPAPPARRSPTSSTSALAAPISARPWRRWRWRPIMTGRARTTSPTSTAPISMTR